MSKINQIQTELRGLDGARFQKLCDAYLHCIGYRAINPLGSMIGKDKVVTGTPDTYVPLPSGKYVFAEYTTTTEGVTAKFINDLSKVFNPEKTGIPISKIGEVVLCHTSVLDPPEDDRLRGICRACGCACTIIGIGQMAEDLYQKYPGLARDFLGITVDTGQVVALDEFVAAYNKGKLATPLDTPFHFREEELGKVIQALEAADLVILSGHPGVGKTRLALECGKRFSEAHPEVQVRCIFNRGVNLFEDLRVHFMLPGHYLLVVDDANRATRFDYVLQLLHEQRADRTIKVIATVRDYALEQIRNAASNYHMEVVHVTQFKDEQIRQLVKDTWDIQHHIVLNRIADIAQGNPRLAMMAAQVAVREKTFDSIYDVSSLYEEYFRSIREDLERLSDKKLLQAAGLIAFFRAVDRTNAVVMKAICSITQLSPEAFWEAVTQLHEIELLDMHETEVVKFSDQVLASYLFYCSVFKERVLAFSDLLIYLFPSFQRRFVDALNPVLSAFDGQALAAYIRPSVNQRWKKFEEQGDEEGLIALIDVFWFAVRTEVLTYIQRSIRQIESVPHMLVEGVIKATGNLEQQPLLNLLQHFQYASLDECRIAIELTLEYLVKRPGEVSQVLHLLTESFGFHDDSYLQEYCIQRAVINELGQRCQGSDVLQVRLLIAVGLDYLQTHCDAVSPARGRAITITRFDLAATSELDDLRRTIWQYVFTFYQQPPLQKEIIDFLHRYSQAGYRIVDAEIIAWDAKQVLPFIESELAPTEFSHCVIVHEFLALLRRHKVDFPHALASRFTNATYNLRAVLLPNWQHRRELGYAEYEEEQQQELAVHFAAYTYEDYIRFLNNCLEICCNSLTERDSDQLRPTTQQVLILLAERDSVLFTEVLEHYLRSGDPLRLDPLFLVSKLIEVNGPDRAHQIITESDCSRQRLLLFSYFHLLPPEYLRPSHLEQLFTLYRETEPENLHYGWNSLFIYCALDPDVLVHVTGIILQRIEEDNRFYGWLAMLFNGFGDDSITQVITTFQNHLVILKRAYCVAQKTHWHLDSQGEMFSAILNCDPNFACEYIVSLHQNNQEATRFDDSREYDFLWQREDYIEIMDGIVECAFALDQQRPFYWESLMAGFFRKYAGDGNPDVLITKRKMDFLARWIEQRNDDASFMDWLFQIIMYTLPDERVFFTECFVRHNQYFADFRSLPLEPSSWIGNGSLVPVIQGRIDSFQVLLPMFSTIALLEHRQYLQQEIDALQKEMEREMKEDFIRD